MSDLELIKNFVPENLQEEALKKLNNGYPVQYIIGNVEFYGNIINVDENVLIPRFETEYLVDKTLNYIKKLEISNPNVLEIGTGSGCISVALKKNLNCEILAIDISEDAINVAQKNAENNQITINFLTKDIHEFQSEEKFDLIISNPPYVPFDGEYDEKIKYEPQNAIFAQDQGLYFYHLILEKIKNNLTEKYLIAFEIGDKQGVILEKICKTYLPNAYIKLEKDYNNYDRYIFISSDKL